MEWSKLKNIILIILVLTNVFLLFFVVQQEVSSVYLRWQARSNAITLLENRGVTVAQEQVPERMTLLPQTVKRDLEHEGALATTLLGEQVQAQARGGEVYRYFNDSGSIQFHSDGAFLATLTPGVAPVGEEREKDCLLLLSKLDFVGELVEEGESTLTFRQLWEGIPLFTQQVTVTMEQGSITSLTSGRRLVGEPTQDHGRKSITVATALIEMLNGITALGDVCSRVDSITQGYVSNMALSGPMSLTPVWQIVTDTGAYQMDTVTGALTRTS